jgi:hypothetical protein
LQTEICKTYHLFHYHQLPIHAWLLKNKFMTLLKCFIIPVTVPRRSESLCKKEEKVGNFSNLKNFTIWSEHVIYLIKVSRFWSLNDTKCIFVLVKYYVLNTIFYVHVPALEDPWLLPTLTPKEATNNKTQITFNIILQSKLVLYKTVNECCMNTHT